MLVVVMTLIEGYNSTTGTEQPQQRSEFRGSLFTQRSLKINQMP